MPETAMIPASEPEHGYRPKRRQTGDNSFPESFRHIKDVPWEVSPAFFQTNGDEYLKAFNSILTRVPTSDLQVSFNDDIWDFNPYMKTVNAQDYKLRFWNLTGKNAEYCKFFALYKMANRTKVTSVSSLVYSISSILSKVFKKKTVQDISLVTFDEIRDVIESRNLSASTEHMKYNTMNQFFTFLKDYYHLFLSVDMKKIAEMEERTLRLANATVNANKTPDIPEDFFNLILNKCLDIMRDESVDSNYRMTAAGIVFLSQTGLRLGDFLSLTTDALHTKRLAKSGDTVNYVHFKVHKPSKAGQPLLEFDIFANVLTTEAFRVMLDVRKETPRSEGSDFLYILKDRFHGDSYNQLPHPTTRFRSVYYRMLDDFLPEETRIPREGIKSHILHHGETNDPKTTVIQYVPDTRQYRVHLATELYNKGVPLIWIERYLGHLGDMSGYYCRPKDTYQENIEYSEKVIREIVDEDLRLLGGNNMGDDITKNIKQFVTDLGYDLTTEIDDVIKALGDRVVIRGKSSGVCIRTTFIPCSKDVRTDHVLCAYGHCPNFFSLFYDVDVTYMDFQNLQDTYTSMKKSGHTRASEKEMNKIKDLIHTRLIPELDELDREINVNGAGVVLTRHPSLIDIVEKRNEIREEAQDWLAK